MSKDKMHLVGYLDRFVPKLVADKLFLEASTEMPPSCQKLLETAAGFVNDKYGTSYTTAVLSRKAPLGISHHLILDTSKANRRSHGRLVIFQTTQLDDEDRKSVV